MKLKNSPINPPATPSSFPLGFTLGLVGGMAAYYLTQSKEGKKLRDRLLSIYKETKAKPSTTPSLDSLFEDLSATANQAINRLSSPADSLGSAAEFLGTLKDKVSQNVTAMIETKKTIKTKKKSAPVKRFFSSKK